MSYKNRAKDRKIKRLFIKFFKAFKFKSLNLSKSQKIILLGSTISIISLFMPWLDDAEGKIEWKNSFSNLVGSVGFIIFIYLVLLIFNTISVNKKEKIKFYSNMHFKDHFLSIVLGVFTVVLGINSIIYIGGLQTFASDIIQGKAMGLCITGAIIIIIGGVIQKKESDNTDIKTYAYDGNMQDFTQYSNDSKENNMKLPF